MPNGNKRSSRGPPWAGWAIPPISATQPYSSPPTRRNISRASSSPSTEAILSAFNHLHYEENFYRTPADAVHRDSGSPELSHCHEERRRDTAIRRPQRPLAGEQNGATTPGRYRKGHRHQTRPPPRASRPSRRQPHRHRQHGQLGHRKTIAPATSPPQTRRQMGSI